MALRVWLPLNGNLENQGLSNYKFNNNGATISNNGKIGSCYSFDGTDDRIYTTGINLENMIFSVGCWFKPNTVTSTTQYLFAMSSDSGGSASQQLGLYINTTGFCIHVGGSYQTKNYTINPNTWYHAIYTCDGSIATLYINGEVVGTMNTIGTVKGINLTLGARSASSSGAGSSASYFYGGFINDFRLYDECLSQKQIKEISKGLVCHYKLTGVKANKNYIKNSDWSGKTNAGIYTFNGDEVTFHSDEFQASSHAFSVPMDTAGLTDFKNKTLTLSMEYQITEALTFGTTQPWVGFELSLARNTTTGGSSQWLDWYGSKSIPTAVTDGWVKYSKTVTVTDYDIASMSINFYLRDTKGTIKYRHPKIEIGDTATDWIPNENDSLYSKWGYANDICTDVSGNDYNLIQNGIVIFNTDSARYNGSTIFPGDCANYLYRPYFSFLTGPFSYTCWVYQTSKTTTSSGSTSNLQMIMSQGRDYSSASYGMNLCSYSGIPRIMIGKYGVENIVIEGTTQLVDGQWHMLTATWDTNIAKLYIDGQLEKSGNVSSIDYSSSTSAFVIGKMSYSYTSTTNYFPFVGSISDARIYCTALSADDILTMYKNSAIIDNKNNVYAYEFKEE